MRKRISKKSKLALDAEERTVERALERGEYEVMPRRQQEIRKAQHMARNTFAKSKTINIRVSERDLVRLRARANREGIPYQTLVASFIRKEIG